MVTDFVIAVFVEDLTRSRRFYQDLLELEVMFEADWIIQLTSPHNRSLNLTLQPKGHELIPESFQKSPQGTSIVFVVEDCDQVFERALEMKLDIVQAPKNEDYGQRRFLTTDPDGLLVDVSSTCEPSKEFIAKYMS